MPWNEKFCHLSKEFFTSRCESAHSLGSSYQNQPLDSEDNGVGAKTDLGQYSIKIRSYNLLSVAPGAILDEIKELEFFEYCTHQALKH